VGKKEGRLPELADGLFSEDWAVRHVYEAQGDEAQSVGGDWISNIIYV